MVYHRKLHSIAIRIPYIKLKLPTGCRWPGKVSSPSALWELLLEGRDTYSRFPPDRVNISSFYHPVKERPGSVFTEGGHFLDLDLQAFDASFFSINASEASSMDPAQRLLLEVVFEAFESCGLSLENVNGTKTGVFVGNMNNDHQLQQLRDTEYPPLYAATGTSCSILSNRVNYAFNLQGPSLTVDTACSSSLYALHLAESALKNGQCDIAVVGGTNIIMSPEMQLLSTKLGALSPTSKCHTFDDRADGYARGEGIGVLVLMRTSDAVEKNLPLRAIVRGTAVNS